MIINEEALRRTRIKEKSQKILEHAHINENHKSVISLKMHKNEGHRGRIELK